jgi:hypothetical protein
MEQLMFPDGDRKSNSVSACAAAGRAMVTATIAGAISARVAVLIVFISVVLSEPPGCGDALG